jgi:hypothetical protein
MQVTHVDDHVTHAVIGGNKSQSFGISDSAEFFNILSNTLYSDKPLAVTREVLCNAWDAHIAAGKTDVPIEITLTKAHLIIRDRGTGIRKELMHSTYCVYGNSTKQNDGHQTGGFGLGCKAPYAYTDNFEVTNFNAGEKTIYRMSKSSGEVGGKPGMLEVVAVPTDETGLQVKIDLLKEDNYYTFHKLILRLVANGGMNATLNGEKLKRIPFNKAKHGFLITDLPISDTHHRLYVRYGNVIYPMEGHQTYSDQYQEAFRLLGNLAPRPTKTGYQDWQLVLQAQPHTISVTPSRESLSMTDATIATLKGLLENFLARKHLDQETETRKLAQECIQRSIIEMKPAALVNNERRLPLLTASQLEDPCLFDFRQVSQALAVKKYPDLPGFRQRDVTLRLEALAQSGFGNRGKIQAFLADYRKEAKLGSPHSNWFHRRLIRPLALAMKAHPQLSMNRLMVTGRDWGNQRRSKWGEAEFTEALKVSSKRDLEEYLPFLRNLVILTYNRADITDRAPHYPAMKHWFGTTDDNLVYVVQRSDPKVEAAREFFKAQGFYVLDLTARQKWEPAPAKQSEARSKEWKPRKKGIPLLSQGLKGDQFNSDLVKLEEVERIETPEFIVKVANRNTSNTIESLSYVASAALIRLFGSKGGAVVNDTQSDKYLKLGAKSLNAYLLEKVIAEVMTNPRIHSKQAVNVSRLPQRYPYDWVYELINNDFALRAHYNIGDTMTDEDKDYWSLWQHLVAEYAYTTEKSVDEAKKVLKDIPVSPDLLQLDKQIRQSQLLDLLSQHEVSRPFRHTKPNEEQRLKQAKARDLLILAIKG